jgi:hypothetical protein
MNRSLRVVSILSIFTIIQSCDRAPQTLGKLKATMDPLIGEWREVASTDTSSIETIVFKADRTFEGRITIRNPQTPDFERKLRTLINSLPATFAKGDSVLVASYDNKAMWKRGKELFGDEIKSADSTNATGTTDAVFRYRIDGDILELTKERTPEDWADPKTKRYVRVRQ